MKSKPLKLNVGCGEAKLEGFINIDLAARVKPDLICDITKKSLPYKAGTVDEIHFLHCIEHIESKHHSKIILEFFRVLKPGGFLILAYPEFEICVTRYLKNHQGRREFYKDTIFGRQLWPGDFHVCPINSNELRGLLQAMGFTDTKLVYEEAPNDGYAILSARKAKLPPNYANILAKEIFSNESKTRITRKSKRTGTGKIAHWQRGKVALPSRRKTGV